MELNLYDIFKHWHKNGTIFFYGDTHFDDPEMKYLRKNYIGDNDQVKSINKYVGKHDTIIFLGDIGNIDYIRKIKGYKVLILGNHDKGVTNYKRFKHEYYVYSNFETRKEIYESAKNHYPDCNINMENKKDNSWLIKVDNQLFDEVYEGPLTISKNIILSHEPILNLPFMYNIYGHDHSNQNKPLYGVNTCPELNNYIPIRLTDIIKNGALKNVKDIHRLTIDKASNKKKEKIV